MRYSKKALLVIDMVHDFVDPKGVLYCGRRARRMIPYVRRKILEFRKKNSLIIYLRDSHRSVDREFDIFKPHALVDTHGNEIIKELAPTNRDYIVGKRFYDGCFGTELTKILSEYRVREVYFTGVCTSICVMETAMHLFYLGYKLCVYKKGVADFDMRAHNFALKRMRKLLGCRVI